MTLRAKSWVNVLDEDGEIINFDTSVGPSSSPASALTTGQNALSTTSEVVVAANLARVFAEIKNADASISVYLGKDSGVSSTTGHLLKAGEAFGFERYTGPIWAIAASATPTVTWVEW